MKNFCFNANLFPDKLKVHALDFCYIISRIIFDLQNKEVYENMWTIAFSDMSFSKVAFVSLEFTVKLTLAYDERRSFPFNAFRNEKGL